MTVLLAMLLCLSLCLAFMYLSQKSAYRRLDRLLDAVLRGEPYLDVGWKEGGPYALAYKIIRLNEKLALEAENSRQEKEQIKQLVSNLSHQLKTPLANVMLYEDILLEKKGLPALETERFLKQMRLQTEKIDWILNSLFKMAKLEQGAIGFDIGAYPIKTTVASALSAVYEQSLKKGVRFSVQGFQEHRLIHNPEWTAEALVNLFENAIKYSPCNSTIKVTFHGYEMYSAIKVRDYGIGVPQQEEQKIFQRFYRGSNAANIQGSGIGLYLSKLIIEKENGYITLDPVAGKGCCFQVLLLNSSP